MVRKFILVTIAVAGLFFPLPAQETGKPGDGAAREVAVARRLQIIMNFSGNIKESEQLLLRESLLIILSEDEDLIIFEPLLSGLADEAAITAAVEAVRGDCWLKLDIKADPEQFTITADSYDLVTRQYVFSGLSFFRDRKIRGITRTFWRSLTDELAKGYNAVLEEKQVIVEYTVIQKEEKIIEQRGVKVTLLAAPGTLITGLQEEPLVVDENGQLSLELLGYATYDLKASCQGYYPLHQQLYLVDIDQTVELKQLPASRGGVDIYLQHLDYLGLGGYYYIIRNLLFVGLSATFFQQKLILPVEENSDRYDLPLTHLFLTAGYYLNPEDSFLRFYLASGLFLRLTKPQNSPLTFDPLSWGGLKLLALNAELYTHLKFKLFAEYCILVYFTRDGNLMRAAIWGVNDSDYMLAGYIFTDHLVFDMLHFKVGCRIQIP